MEVLNKFKLALNQGNFVVGHNVSFDRNIIGAEFLGFALLLISAILIGLWAYFGKHRGILLLQIFYASAGIIGMIRWF